MTGALGRCAAAPAHGKCPVDGISWPACPRISKASIVELTPASHGISPIASRHFARAQAQNNALNTAGGSSASYRIITNGRPRNFQQAHHGRRFIIHHGHAAATQMPSVLSSSPAMPHDGRRAPRTHTTRPAPARCRLRRRRHYFGDIISRLWCISTSRGASSAAPISVLDTYASRRWRKKGDEAMMMLDDARLARRAGARRQTSPRAAQGRRHISRMATARRAQARERHINTIAGHNI